MLFQNPFKDKKTNIKKAPGRFSMPRGRDFNTGSILVFNESCCPYQIVVAVGKHKQIHAFR